MRKIEFFAHRICAYAQTCNAQRTTQKGERNEKKNEFKAGDTITLTISRNGKDTDVQVTLQEVTQGDTLFGDQEAVEN